MKYIVCEFTRDVPRTVGRFGKLFPGDVISMTPAEWVSAQSGGNFVKVKESSVPEDKRQSISPQEEARLYHKPDLGEMDHGELLALAWASKIDVSHCRDDEAIRATLQGELDADDDGLVDEIEAKLATFNINQLKTLCDHLGVTYGPRTQEKGLRAKLMEFYNASDENAEKLNTAEAPAEDGTLPSDSQEPEPSETDDDQDEDQDEDEGNEEETESDSDEQDDEQGEEAK